MNRRRTSHLLVASAMAACMATGALAEPAKVDSKAQTVIDSMLAAYKGLNAYHSKSSVAVTLTPAPTSAPTGATIDFKGQKPSKFTIEMLTKTADGKDVTRRMVCNGTTIWSWQNPPNQYVKDKVPGAQAQLRAAVGATGSLDGLLFMGENPFAGIPENTVVTLAAPEKVGDVDVDVIDYALPKGAGDQSTVRVYVGQKDHLFRRLSISGTGKDPQSGKEMSMKREVTVDTIDTAPTFTDADFTFAPPAGAKLLTPPTAQVKPKTAPKPAPKTTKPKAKPKRK